MLCQMELQLMPCLHDLLNQVYSLHCHDAEHGLDRCLALLHKLGNPHLRMPPVFHVAGTNGKGSTLAFVKQILQDNGYTVHRYTSPHLVRFNERIELCGVQVTDEVLTDALAEILTVNAGVPLTTFEAITCLAFLLFARYPADFLLLEVGLGGRLDATNVIQNPIVTAITSISLDHQADLGNTVEEIAAEKADIIKQGVPVVIPENLPESVYLAIKLAADKLNAPMVVAQALPECNLGLQGVHQQSNAAVALQMIKSAGVVCSNVELSLTKVKWPGRLQCIQYGQTKIWIDGAHNEAGAYALTQSLRRISDSSWVFFIHIKTRKDAKALLTHFALVAKLFYFVDCPIEGGERTSLIELKLIAQELDVPFLVISSLDEMFSVMKSVSLPVIATGSLFYIGSIFEYLLNK